MRSSAKQFISLGLLGLMLVKVWVIPLLYLDFEIRRDYIVANLCENRNRPMMNCNGKCYLAKRIAETKKQEERQAEKNYMASLIYQVMNTKENYKFQIQSPVFEVHSFISYKYKFPFAAPSNVDDIFHPPLG